MGRAPRHDPEGGWHHVMNRGLARQKVFHTAGDGRMFLSLLAEGHDQFGVEVHAYCLMDNHYHLVLHCPAGCLSEYMQHVGSSYTRYLNVRLGRDGPIFRGRFRSLIIDSDEYLSCASRYIHRNPLDVRPPVALDEYRWSSFAAYCGRVAAPQWLHLTTLLSTHGGSSAYRSFVEAGGSSGSHPVIGWAISTALAEHPDHGTVRPATVALLMLDGAEPSLAQRIRETLGIASPAAFRSARHRARQRRSQDPSLEGLVRRALHLAR